MQNFWPVDLASWSRLFGFGLEVKILALSGFDNKVLASPGLDAKIRVPTDLENLENSWNFMLDLECLAWSVDLHWFWHCNSGSAWKLIRDIKECTVKFDVNEYFIF